jgi:hypothetical protein
MAALKLFLLVAAQVVAVSVVDAKPLLDPTRPPDVAVTTTRTHQLPDNKPVLNTIIYGPNRQMASVNGHLMRVGDEKDGIELLALTARSARVQFAGRTIDLSLGSRKVHKELK